MTRPALSNWLVRIASCSALAVSGCGGSSSPDPSPVATPPAISNAPPPAVAPGSTPGAASPAAVTVDPAETYRQLIEALNTKVQLIASVQDLASAKAVSDRFPEAARRHRELDRAYRNALFTDAQRRELEQPFGTQLADLDKSWNQHYSRVALIPGAWEHMHPELAPLADMTVYPEDAAGLETAIVGLLEKTLVIQRQVTDAESARRLSSQYRVTSARIGVLLNRLNLAHGVRGGQEYKSAAIEPLRRQYDAERQRIGGLTNAARALEGEAAAPTVVVVDSNTEWGPMVSELRSGDLVRVRNTLNQMGGIHPPPAWKSQVFPDVVKLLDFEPVRGSAAEVLKKGWFGAEQVSLVFDAADSQQDKGIQEGLYEGISRVPNLDAASIERLAAKFPQSPGRTVQWLRNVGPEAEKIAQTYAGHDHREVRMAVCEVLRDIGSSASNDVLEQLSHDKEKSVVSKAKEALREIAKPTSQRPHLRNR